MVFINRTALVCIVTLLLLAGCSGGGGINPITPGDLTTQNTQDIANNHFTWEVGEVTIDPDTGTAEVVPLRGADFNVNIVKFLQPPAGVLANLSVTIDVPNSNFAKSYVELDTKLTHPFPGTVYWGFDTRVIVFAAGSMTGKHDTSVKYPAPTELRMVNADGWTRWWNRTEFGPMNKIFGYTEGAMAPSFTPASWSTVNGYKYFANGITSTQEPPNPAIATRGTFSSGSVTRRMKIQFPTGVPKPFQFKYSVDTSFENPTANPPTSVSDFPVGANCQEPYQIVVTQDPASTAFYDATGPTFGGDLILSIEVWDWRQGGGTVENEISGIWIESPTLLNNKPGNVVEVKSTWTATPGSTANSVIYSGTITDCTPTAVTNQDLMITIESSAPTTYAPPAGGFLYPSANLAAYQLFKPTIKDNGTTTKSITVTSPNGGETLIIAASHTITWTWTGAITDVVIDYSTDGGTSYPNPIVASTPCDGSYDWTPIPDTPTTTAKVRITEAGASPEAQDESNNNFTISSTAVQGWNPIPGQMGMVVDDPEPNQSTASPDLGIQNDDAGNEGAWLVDQEGGIADGTPLFYDYMLDWSGPGGDSIPSGLNYLGAPLTRHDVSANAIVIGGCLGNGASMNPPAYNDPFTAAWYLTYLLDDEGQVPGYIMTVSWGDSGTVDPPVDDPDAVPWIDTVDACGGIVVGENTGFLMEYAFTWLNTWSHEAGAPEPEAARLGDLGYGYWPYPYVEQGQAGNIHRLSMPDWTTDADPPSFQAFDVSDPAKCRLAADTDPYVSAEYPQGSGDYYYLTVVNMLDSLGNFYSTFVTDDYDPGYLYLPLQYALKIRNTADPLYFEGGTAVDLETLPTITVFAEGDYEAEKNWTAVLFDDGEGGWVVRVYRIDWTVETDPITIVDTTDPIAGTPLAVDVDNVNFTIHVLYEDGGDIKATVFNYTE